MVAGGLLLMPGSIAQYNKSAAERPMYDIRQHWVVLCTQGKYLVKMAGTDIRNKLQAGRLADMAVMAAASQLFCGGTVWR